MSFIFIVNIGFVKDGRCPCCVEAYIFREYAAAINLISIIKIDNTIDLLKIAVKSIISLNKLIDGGAAIFQAVNKNHQADKIGNEVMIPLVKYMLRVCVISYVRFARINRADEHRPWAIIIISPPHIAQLVLVMILANISPMCPTEE
jgi:hypothetical protein